MEEIKITIEKKDNVTIFTNGSPMCMHVSLIPVTPKRKYIDIMVVKPGKCVIHDGFRMDFSRLSFRFTPKQEVLDERN